MLRKIALLAAMTGLPGSAQPQPAAAAAESGHCQTDKHGYCTDRVVDFDLTYAVRSPEIRINTTLGHTTTIVMPPLTEIRGEPKLGNKGPFKVELVPATKGMPAEITIWPQMPEAAGNLPPDALGGEHSNLVINLVSGFRIRIHLQITNEKEQAVDVLQLRFPEREKEEDYVRRRIQELSRERLREYDRMKTELTENHDKDVRRESVRKKIGGQKCTDFSSKHDENGLFVLYVSQICQEGDSVYMHLKLSNLARNVFRLGSVAVMPADSDSPLEATVEWRNPDAVRLGRKGKMDGVAEVQFGPEGPAGEYRVRVTEAGGKQRVVEVDGIEL